MYDGGIRLIEYPYDASGYVSDEETASNIEMLVNHFGAKIVVGAGTVLTEKQVPVFFYDVNKFFCCIFCFQSQSDIPIAVPG